MKGDKVLVTLEKETEERKVEIPEDLAAAWSSYEHAKTVFQSLSYTPQKEYVSWITSAKRVETRLERVKKTLE